MKTSIMMFFDYDHLPENLQQVSKSFKVLADGLDKHLADNEEKEMALRKLLESKDCAVRAHIIELRRKKNEPL